jgi:hypothetical protein
MKRCPECAAEYDDAVAFCAKDGRSLIPGGTIHARLCPHCANGIAADAAQCPYCKADLAPAAPEWLIRDERPADVQPAFRERNLVPKALLAAGVLLCALAAALFAAGILGRGDATAVSALLAQKTQELQAKDEQVKGLEAALSKLREESAALGKAQTDLQARLEESQKELAGAEQRLKSARAEIERSGPPQAPSQPARDVRPAAVSARPAPGAGASASPGVYETARATNVYDHPARSARVITRVSGGTRINVVRGDGEWLEVVSKRGNPPGYILRADVRAAEPAR